MDVLLTESAQGLGAPAAAGLRALGHRVFQCHPVAGRGDFGCLAALDGGRCPLDTGGVDVVLDVRGPDPEFTTREYAVVCARRAAAPLVVAGEALPAIGGDAVQLGHVVCPRARGGRDGTVGVGGDGRR
jgi:hypothetical protein